MFFHLLSSQHTTILSVSSYCSSLFLVISSLSYPCAFSSYILTWAFHGFSDLWVWCTLTLPQLLFLGCFFISTFFSVDETLLPSHFPRLLISAAKALTDATRPLLFIPQLLLKSNRWLFSTGQYDVCVVVAVVCVALALGVMEGARCLLCAWVEGLTAKLYTHTLAPLWTLQMIQQK